MRGVLQWEEGLYLFTLEWSIVGHSAVLIPARNMVSLSSFHNVAVGVSGRSLDVFFEVNLT